MTDALLQALLTLLSAEHLIHLVIGVVLGLIVGILPGLGGVAGFSLILPFIYGMDPVSALALLIGMVAVINTSDVFTAILMGIAGSASGQVTVMEGFPLAKKGQAARALSAAFSASLIGGLFGAFVLTMAVFVAKPIILSIGFGEQLMLVVLGLSMVGLMTGSSPVKGIAACGLGLLLGAVGSAPATGEWRMTFGITYLADGMPLTIVALGIFAIPEIVDLLRQKSAIAKTAALGSGWLTGIRDTLSNIWLVLRCSSIGVFLGALPGMGGAVVDWASYGHTIQSTKNKEYFGQGEIRGLVGPEAANNAKEGGALIPTILFGIPGSGGMAVFLGGMILLGIQPGIGMIDRQLDLTYTIVWSLALANVIGTAICIAIARPISQLTTIRYVLIAPFMLMLIFFAAFQATRDWGDIVLMLVLGIVGIYLKRFGWPRAALLIGFVLSRQLEVSVYQAIQVYGLTFFQRPIVLFILFIVIVSTVLAIRSKRSDLMSGESVTHRRASLAPQAFFAALVVLALVAVIWDAIPRGELTRLYPLIVGGITLLLAIAALVSQLRSPLTSTAMFDAEVDYSLAGTPQAVSAERCMLWIVGMVAAVYALGTVLGMAVFFMTFLTVNADRKPLRNIILTLSGVGFLVTMATVLTLRYPPGILQQLLPMPWPFG